MSTTVVTYPIVMALKEAERLLGPDRKWESANETQTRFLGEFFDCCRHESIPEIQSLASWNAEEINDFLGRRGFALRARPFSPNHFGTASVLDLIVEWIEPGTVTTIETKRGFFSKRTYPGVLVYPGVSFFRAAGHGEPIACLATKSGDQVFMTVCERPKNGLDLVAMAEELTTNGRAINDFWGVEFPMVHLDHFVDISWVEGMQTTAESGAPAGISKAFQQTRLRMNERGARAESAVLLELTGAAFSVQNIKPPLVIDRPFLVWIKRQGLAKPLFVGHITEEDWKNPGDITTAS